MTEDDRKAFDEIFDLVSEMTIMPSGKDLERMKKVLFFGLMEYPLDRVIEAAKAHCRVNKFFPMLADIIVQIEGSFEDRAALAWSLVMKAKRKYRRNKTLRFPSPAIHYAIECMGGWSIFTGRLTMPVKVLRQKNFSGSTGSVKKVRLGRT